MCFCRPNSSNPEPEKRGTPRRDRMFAAALLALLVAARLGDLTPIVTLRLWTFDLEAVLRPPAKTAATVAVVDIDDASLLAVGQWPWPRDVLAGLVDDQIGRAHV